MSPDAVMGGPAAEPRPPVLAPSPRTHEHHGVRWSDPWGALADHPDALAAVLDAEDDLSRGLLGGLAPEVARLAAIGVDEMQHGEASPPQCQDGWWYASTLAPGASLPRVVRARVVDPDRPPTTDEVVGGADSEVVVDLEAEAASRGRAFGIGGVSLAPGGRRVAWTTDVVGDERFDLWVRDIARGRTTDTGIRDIGPSAVFSTNGHDVVVLALDDRGRPHEVWAVDVRAPERRRRLLSEPDPRFRLRLSKSSSGRFVMVTATSKAASRTFVLWSDDVFAAPVLVARPPEGTTASLTHLVLDGRDWFAATFDEAGRDQRVALAPAPVRAEGADDAAAGRTSPDGWVTVLSSGSDSTVSQALALRSFLLVGIRRDARTEIMVAPLDGARGPDDVEFTTLPADGEDDLRIGSAPAWEDRSVEVALRSQVRRPRRTRIGLDRQRTPTQIHDGGRTESADAGPAHLVQCRRSAVSADGTDVPMTLVGRRDLLGLGQPVLMTAYGAYGVSMEPAYDPILLDLVERGLLVCTAHVRGGGERGRAWHDAARGVSKSRSMDDLLACREALVGGGLAIAGRIGVKGGSAGGLLVAAALNREPSAFDAVLVDVPFVDPLTSMLDPSLPLTISDRHEWGDPIADEAVFRAMRAYSPYENVVDAAYPPVLATVARHDSRVSPSEAVKWIHRLRAVASGGPFLLASRDEGHVGSRAIEDGVRRVGLEYAWLASQLGLDAPVLPK